METSSRIALPPIALSLVVAAGFLTLSPDSAQACPAEPYIGTICSTGANYCPTDYYQQAAGQTITISTNPALYSLIGWAYGGDQKTYFNLPDLRARTPVAIGQSAGTQTLSLGQKVGQDKLSLGIPQLPVHTHNATLSANGAIAVNAAVNLTASATDGSAANPSSATPFVAGGKLTDGTLVNYWTNSASNPVQLTGPAGNTGAQVTGITVTNQTVGSGAPITTLPPQVGMTYCIAVTGLYPPRP